MLSRTPRHWSSIGTWRSYGADRLRAAGRRPRLVLISGAHRRRMTMATATLETTAPLRDTFPINGTDYIEFYVGNARPTTHYYRAAFGFQLIGDKGPKTYTRVRAHSLLPQWK